MKPFVFFGSAIRTLFFLALFALALGLVLGGGLVLTVSQDLPKLPTPLNRIIETPQSLIYASNGQVLIALGERKAISLDMVSPDFLNAIVATEDHLFFDHHGINKLRTLKGLYITLFKPGQVQGASTITQQLAKNLFFSFEKSWYRKFKELLVALQIEAANTKEEILEAYVNQIHFGAGTQGIEKAAQTFFGKSAIDLDLAEASLLAGLPKSPSQYNPFTHYDRALARRSVVLGRMTALGFISAQEAKTIDLTRPMLHQGRRDARTGSYFLDALIHDLIQAYGEDVVFHGGIKVYSTLDPRLQAMAETSMTKELDRLDTMMGLALDAPEKPQGALVAIDTASGGVKAMVGGRNYYLSEFNRAIKARRQPGSGFKPFLYYAAFQGKGYHPATRVVDRPVSIPVAGAPDWSPENFEHRYGGPMILKQALISSVNTIAAQLVEQIGPEAVIDVAKACGVKSPLENVYSVALGTSGVTVFDMAASFSVFANLGVRRPPFLFWRIEDARGRVIFEHIVKESRVLDPALAFQVVDMMSGVVDTGSGRTVRKLGFKRPAAGKTGTTDNYNDAWFTGFTPSLSSSVWVGFDRKKMLKNKRGGGITGGRGAVPIWTDFMGRALAGEPVRGFGVPSNIRFETVDGVTGCPVVPILDPGSQRGIPEQGPGQNHGVHTLKVAMKTGQSLCSEDKNAPPP
ncbi:MAG: PBP1A family penicillin-binding protein [Desulfobacter sp.]|nr:PBP1A family penicillin-binding protein [Desulfobacter sp.]WDP85045.1 MAG: PBP1A family penicillin-binding protein [Desulfobacter sp.]